MCDRPACVQSGHREDRDLVSATATYQSHHPNLNPMDSTITLAPDNHSKTTARRLPRPKVRFMRPEQLAPYTEQVWAIYEATFERSRAEFEATFDAIFLYAVFFVGQ